VRLSPHTAQADFRKKKIKKKKDQPIITLLGSGQKKEAGPKIRFDNVLCL
jgi:hypothetical protein